MRARLELARQRFGRLKVLKLAEIKNKSTWWLCKCDCGNTTIVKGAKLRNGHTQSCGCLQKEAAAKALRAVSKQQANNKRTNVYVSFYDQTKTIAQWAELLNMRDDTLRRRLKKGWSIFKALTTPTRKWRRHNVVA